MKVLLLTLVLAYLLLPTFPDLAMESMDVGGYRVWVHGCRTFANGGVYLIDGGVTVVYFHVGRVPEVQ